MKNIWVTQGREIVFYCMFIRKKKNHSGTISVVVIDKSNNRFCELKTIGTSSDEKKIDEFCEEGKKWISKQSGKIDMLAAQTQIEEEREVVDNLIPNIENILLNGTQLILDKVFDLVGFQAIRDDILRHLAIARLCQPRSKVGTVNYLKSHFDEDASLDKIYRYLDKLNDNQKEEIQRISV